MCRITLRPDVHSVSNTSTVTHDTEKPSLQNPSTLLQFQSSDAHTGPDNNNLALFI